MYPRVRRLLWVVGRLLVGMALVALALFAFARPTPPEVPIVTLTVNGARRELVAPHKTVGELLATLGYAPTPDDILTPPAATPLRSGLAITLIYAREIEVIADGQTVTVQTHATTIADLLRVTGHQVAEDDRFWLDDQPATATSLLPEAGGDDGRPRGTVRIERAITVSVTDDGAAATHRTVANTVGQALREMGMSLFPGDLITPTLSSPLTDGLGIEIARAVPVTLKADGLQIHARTHASTVAQLLAEQQLSLRPLDLLTPTLSTPLTHSLAITITRLDHHYITETEVIPFQTEWVPDATIELDTIQLVQEGREGVYAYETLVFLQDGQEISRAFQRERISVPAQNQVYAYGTKIVIRTLETPSGPVQYWRKMRVLATSYTAASSGKARNHPEFGITRTGRIAGKGIIAVDPKVIRLNSMVYVPDYGISVAGDTGGRVKGRHVDLGYEEEIFVPWFRWIDIYLLTPVPPSDTIRWILPTWPLGRSGEEIRGWK